MFNLKFSNRYQNQMYTSYNIKFPEEDYFNLHNNIFCVADGVTRDLKGGKVVPYPKTKEEAEYIANNYPNPSGAYMSSKICADNFIKYIQEYNENEINETVILEAIKKANKDIWEINKDRKIDYTGEDLYCSEAVGGIILNDYLYCFAIGDCYIKCYNENFEEVFSTENDHLWMENFEDEFLKSGEYNWFDPRYRILIRAALRNNPIITHNGKKVGYGALTGEDTAIDFVKTYKIDLKNIKYICAYSDGCMPYFEKEKAKETILNPNIIEKEGSERSVIIYEKERNMRDLISIIVPVYNVEDYLEKCVNSIINQTYKNIEIILVNDGSKDKSGEICDKLKTQDNRIKVVHKENGGIADTRNAGLKIATGKYIGFVDSDDYIENDMYETLYNIITEHNADISIVSYYEIYKGKVIGVRDSKKIKEFNKLEALKELLIDNEIQSYTWNKLFKREVFDNVIFPINKYFEDIATTILLFENANKVVLFEDPKYYYARRDNSILGEKNYKSYKDYLEIILKNYMYLDGKYDELDLNNAYNFVLYMIRVYPIIVSFELEQLNEEFEKNFSLFKKIIDKYKNKIIDMLDDFNKIILYMMLVDKEACKSAAKELYVTFKNKREEGLFDIQF